VKTVAAEPDTLANERENTIATAANEDVDYDDDGFGGGGGGFFFGSSSVGRAC